MRVVDPFAIDTPSPRLVQQNTETTKHDERATYRPTYVLLVQCFLDLTDQLTNYVPSVTQLFDAIPEFAVWLSNVKY